MGRFSVFGAVILIAAVTIGTAASLGEFVTTRPEKVPYEGPIELKPAPRNLGAKVVAGNADVNVSNLTGHESEVRIEVNPTNPNNQVVVGHSPDFVTMSTFYTFDGGQTWTLVPLGDAEDGETSTFRFDPSIAFDDDGNVYVAYGITITTVGGTDTKLMVAKSTNGGVSYTTFTSAGSAPDDPAGTSLPGSDKWQLATGPDQDDPAQQNIYLALTANLDDPGGLDQRIVIIPSFDAGEHFITSVIVNDDSLGDNNSTGNLFAEAAIGPNGEIYVIWHKTDTGEIFFDEGELVGGITFGTDVLVTTIDANFTTGNGIGFKATIPAQPDRGVFAGPVLDVDRSGGAHNGRLYLVYADIGANLGALPDVDVFVRHSDDQGATWSAPTLVNDDGGTGSQFLPWLDVDQGSGAVSVVWYDTRNDGADQKVEIFMSVSGDGAATFEPNVRVSDGQSDQSTNNANRTMNNYLEYIGIACEDDNAYMVWADNSADLADLDYYTDHVSAAEILNDAPIADAGTDQVGTTGNLVTLDGSGSSDPDSGPSPLTFTWTQTIGPAVTLSGAGTAAPTFVPTEVGDYTFSLVVADGLESSAPDIVSVTVTEPPVVVPNVVGFEQAAAESAITSAGLTVGTVTQQNSDTIESGHVISQNPASETEVSSGSAVDLVVSLGPATVAVPDVVGQTQAAAETAITNAGLTVGTVTQQHSDAVTAGNVISQDPAATTQVSPGSAVNFVVSLGPAPISVPIVVGLSQAAAETSITNAGLSVGDVSTQHNAEVPAGNVISQSPDAGTEVAPGSAVDLVVSLGAPTAVVPVLLELNQAEAEAAISTAGFGVGDVSFATNDTIPAGEVITQVPAGGTDAPLGSAIDFTVSIGPDGAVGEVPDPTQEASVTFESTGHPLDGASIVIPANSLSNPTPVFFIPETTPEGPPTDGHIALVVSLGPSGLVFDPPALVRIPWPHVPEGVTPIISVAVRDPNTGELDESGIADVAYADGFVTFTTTHFSDFAVVTVAGDLNIDGEVDAVDVQLTINAALDIDTGVIDADINNDGAIDAVDVQLAILAALN
jgi:beta-lactam-binding protein with PASTA domain